MEMAPQSAVRSGERWHLHVRGRATGLPISHILRLTSLLVRVMQAWERRAGMHTLQAVIPQPVQFSCVLSSHLISSIIHLACITSSVSCGIFNSRRDSPRISHFSRKCSLLHSTLAGLVARPLSREKRDGIFSS